MHPESTFHPAAAPVWLAEARRRLIGLGLPPEWPEESIEAPGIRASRLADCVLRLLAEIDFPPAQLLPCLEGGVRIAFARAGRYAAVELLNSGDMVATCSAEAGEAPRVWPVTSGVADLETTLDAIRVFLAAEPAPRRKVS